MNTVLIVGSGIAGLSCAIQAAENQNRVIMVSPYPSERAQSVMAAGGINAALDTAHDSPAQHAEDTVKSGCGLASATAIEGMCRAAPGIVRRLQEWGCVFTREQSGELSLRAFGGQTEKRTAFAGTSTGKQIVSALVQKAREYQIKGLLERRVGLWFYSALICEGECYGALLYNERSGKLECVTADATVVATGGLNGLFGTTTGSTLCDGYVTAKLFLQGVELKNPEFIQHHPTVLQTANKYMLISEAARSEGGRLYYEKDGKRVYFMEERFGKNGNLMSRDVVSKCIAEVQEPVFLDISHLPAEKIKRDLPEVYELCGQYADIDVTKEPIPVTPFAHFFMGGLSVNDNHATNVSRLYAIGECAALYHGANRLGGNSLLASFYGGQVAAREAAALAPVGARDFSAFLQAETQAIAAWPLKKGETLGVQVVRELAQTMRISLGVFRTKEGLEAGLAAIDGLLEKCKKLFFGAGVPLYQMYRLEPQLALARAILLAALFRCESRGAHQRSDYPDTLASFGAATLVSYDGGAYTVRLQEEKRT